MTNPNKIVKKILGDKVSPNKKLPHECYTCGEGLDTSDYLYHKGNYYHNDCFPRKKALKRQQEEVEAYPYGYGGPY